MQFLTPLLILVLVAPAAPPNPGSDGDTAPGEAAPRAETDAAPDGDDSGQVTRYQFTGLDIDGELRTPALLQFLSRIGGEFETLGIPHRSFIPELEATTAEDAL